MPEICRDDKHQVIEISSFEVVVQTPGHVLVRGKCMSCEKPKSFSLSPDELVSLLNNFMPKLIEKPLAIVANMEHRPNPLCDVVASDNI